MVFEYRTVAGGRAAREVDTVTVQLQLIHGDIREKPQRLLIVGTSKHSTPPQQPTPLRRFLWERIAQEYVASRPKPKLLGRGVPKQESLGEAERPVVVPIDQVPQSFALLEKDAVQVAELNLPDHRVVLWAHRWPIEDVELVTVTDLTPYLEARRRLAQQRRTARGLDEPDR